MFGRGASLFRLAPRALQVAGPKITPQQRRFFNAPKEYENLVERYKEAGGCVSCLRENKYQCEDQAACTEKDEDREMFRMVRTSILDIKERVFSRDRVKAELQIPEKPPGPIKLDNWENYLSSRGILGARDAKYQRYLSKPLTFPLTIAQFLADDIDYPLTEAGKKAFGDIKSLLKQPSKPFLRICFLGVRAELSFPATFWKELGLIYPNYNLSLIMVGPEAPLNLDTQIISVSKNVSVSCYRKYYHEIHSDLAETDYLPDLYIALNSGIGYEGYKGSWDDTFNLVMNSKKPLLFTSHDLKDQERDLKFLKLHENRFEWLLHPSPNKFKSLFYDVLSSNIRYIINTNWSVFALQGK